MSLIVFNLIFRVRLIMCYVGCSNRFFITSRQDFGIWKFEKVLH